MYPLCGSLTLSHFTPNITISNGKENRENHLPQLDKAIATELRSLVASGVSRTTPLTLSGAIT